MNISFLFLCLCFLFDFGSAFKPRPPKPSKDEFYKAPSDIDKYKEGDIVKWRNPPSQIRALLYPINIEGAWQFMFRSTNTQGEPIGVVATLLRPYKADPAKVLAYNYFEDSANTDCAPSYSILVGAGIETIATQLESIYMNVALTRGWYVLVTDYEGPNAAFGASKLSGMAVLDAIRATLKSEDRSGVLPDAKVAIWGYSGGSIPSAWAGALQPAYAPELKDHIIGIVAGGLVANLTSVVEVIDGGVYAGLVGAGILGLATEYPKVQEELFSLIDPARENQMKGLYDECLVSIFAHFVNVEFLKGESPVFEGGPAFLERPEIKEILDENILAFDEKAPVPEVPFFVYHAEHDGISPYEDTKRVYDNWCSNGMKSFEFAVSQTSGHDSEFAEGSGAAIAWLTKIFSGESPIPRCELTIRKSNLQYPGADQGFWSIVRTTIQGALYKMLGALTPEGNINWMEKFIYDALTALIELLGVLPFKRD